MSDPLPFMEYDMITYTTERLSPEIITPVHVRIDMTEEGYLALMVEGVRILFLSCNGGGHVWMQALTAMDEIKLEKCGLVLKQGKVSVK